MDELEREHKQRVSLALIGRATQVATRLRRLTDASRILVAYHDVDEPLTELERYVLEAVMALDREIQHQIDIARGKSARTQPVSGTAVARWARAGSRRLRDGRHTPWPRLRNGASGR